MSIFFKKINSGIMRAGEIASDEALPQIKKLLAEKVFISKQIKL